MSAIPERQSTSCQEFEQFVQLMDRRKDQILREKDRAYWYWFAAQWTVLIAGASGSVIAFFVQTEIYKHYSDVAKVLVVALPALSSLAAAVLTNLRPHELWQIRDEGRVKLMGVAQRGHIRLGACTTPHECQMAHEELEKEFSTIEKSISDQWFASRRAPQRKNNGGGV